MKGEITLLVRVKKVKAQYLKNGNIQLSGLSEQQVKNMKNNLTYSNPTYLAVKKFSKWNNTNVPQYLTYFKQVDNSTLQVPAGYDLTYLNPDIIADFRVTNPVTFPEFLLTLRPDQQEAAKAYEDLNSTPLLFGNIQMPTGKGKSILGLYLAHKLSQKTLIVVHKDDLVTGWKKEIELCFGGKLKSGLIKAKSRVIGEEITIATIQTLNRLPKDELEYLLQEFGFVIQDENHHIAATSFSLTARFNSRYKLGLTATPERTDGLTHIIKLFFGQFAYLYTYVNTDSDILNVEVLSRIYNNIYFNPVYKLNRNGRYEIAERFAPRDYRLKESEYRLSDIPYAVRPKVPYHKADDFSVLSLQDYAVEDIVKEYVQGHSCVAFFTQKKHCISYFDQLVDIVGRENVSLYYGDAKDNDEVLELVEDKRQHITLTTYAKATEGTNVTRWEVAFFVSSMNNEKNTEQASGRIRRTRKDKDKLKVARIYDYRTPSVFSFSSHGRTRDMRYRKLRFIMQESSRSLFNFQK